MEINLIRMGSNEVRVYFLMCAKIIQKDSNMRVISLSRFIVKDKFWINIALIFSTHRRRRRLSIKSWTNTAQANKQKQDTKSQMHQMYKMVADERTKWSKYRK